MKATKRAFAKIAAAFVAAAMALAMSLPAGTGTAHAADQLPDLSRKCSITIHKSAISPDLRCNLTHQDTGGVLPDSTVVGKVNGQDVTLGSLPKLANVQFDIRQMMLNANNQWVTDDLNGYHGVITTDANGVATTGQVLAAGVYQVVELPNANVVQATPGFLIEVPMEDKINGGWLYDVHVYPKNVVNAGPTIEKAVTEEKNMHDSKNNGEKVEWLITVSIPSDIAKAQRFTVTDRINKYLEVDLNDDITAEFIDSNGRLQTLHFNTRDFDANLFRGSGNNDGYDWTSQLVMDFMPAVNKLASAYPVHSSVPGAVPTLVIKFKTKIKIPDSDLMGIMGKDIYNKADLDFKNSLGTEYKPGTDKPEVHVGGIVLEKVDANNNAIIKHDDKGNRIPNGARFAIFNSEADARSNTNPVMTVAADKDGLVRFFGLQYGGKGDPSATASKKYWVVELDAPDGYNRLNAPFEVTITANSHSATANKPYQVVNHKFDLPHTGGAGTAVLVIGGSAMIGASIALVVMMRRRNKKEAAAKAQQA